MALIDLHLIGELVTECHLNESMIEAYLLGWEGRGEGLSDSMIVGIVKLNRQVDTLSKGLQKLHQHCVDFSSGDIAPYIENYEKYREDEDSPPFDPIGYLGCSFYSDFIYDLPLKIEQYKELVEFLPRFAQIKKIRRSGLDLFFGNIKKSYMVRDENGEPVLVPEAELPDTVVNQIKASREIQEINVEYCLDNYNTFRATCLSLIETYRPLGDYVGCATEILKLFAPYTQTGSHE